MTYDITYENDDLMVREIEANDKAIIESWYHEKCPADDQSNDAEHDWFHEYEKDPNTLILIAEEKKTLHKPIGVVKLKIINKKYVKFCGYIIGEKLAKGKGYSTSMIILTHTFLFQELYPKYICIEVDADNRPAVDTYIKAGYKINELFTKDDRDMYFMRVLNPNYYEAID